jgi:DNA-directed RNA polymerase sigma subunit (sigma70/sigma32)
MKTYRLTERRRRIPELRKSGMTLKEIGREMGISAERIRQILKDIERFINKN